MNTQIIKCRAVISFEDKMLVVRHSLHRKFYALPGGHLEEKENPKECIEREIFEEFGVKAEIGRLLYINQFDDPDKSFLEFFFEVINGADFKDLDEDKIDKKEIVEVLWVDKDNSMNILPKKINEDFKNDLLINDEVRFIKD
jgi:8-oxo-dGTP diphosphatase